MCFNDASRDAVSLAEHGSLCAPNVLYGIVHMTYQNPTFAIAVTNETHARRKNWTLTSGNIAQPSYIRCLYVTKRGPGRLIVWPGCNGQHVQLRRADGNALRFQVSVWSVSTLSRASVPTGHADRRDHSEPRPCSTDEKRLLAMKSGTTADRRVSSRT